MKMRTFPIIKCLTCNHEWRRYAKRKLTPSRNCPECFARLVVENQDYEWVTLGNFGDKDRSTKATPESKTHVNVKTEDMLSILQKL